MVMHQKNNEDFLHTICHSDWYSNATVPSSLPPLPNRPAGLISQVQEMYTSEAEQNPENMYHEINDTPQSFLEKQNQLSAMFSKNSDRRSSQDQVEQ